MSKGRLLDGAARVWARARPRLLPCAVSIGLLASLALVVDLDAVPGVVAAARPELLLLMLASTIGERLFAAWRWRVLLRLADPRAPGFGPVLRITFASNFVGVFLPGVDDDAEQRDLEQE